MSGLHRNEVGRTLIYVMAIFGGLYDMFLRASLYEAQFTMVDYTHRFLELLRVFLLSMVVGKFNNSINQHNIICCVVQPQRENFFLKINYELLSLLHIFLSFQCTHFTCYYILLLLLPTYNSTYQIDCSYA